MGQLVFFGVLVGVVVTGAAQVLAETVFTPRPAREEGCSDLVELRARLDAAFRNHDAQGELASVAAFRAALGGEAGRDWDLRVMQLIDGCPEKEADAARALFRLRASDENLVRIDAQLGAPLRAETDQALAPIPPPLSPPMPSP